jgi:hypothetical protein
MWLGPSVAASVAGTRAFRPAPGHDSVVATMRARGSAAGPCSDKSGRYVDCGNGTVTDTLTGLVWLKQANCLPQANWKAANEAAAGLKAGDCGLRDGSSPGDWRLPTKIEWETTIARAIALGCTFGKAPTLTNDAGTSCYADGSGASTSGVLSLGYWSSTLNEINPLSTIFPNASVVTFADLHHGIVASIESVISLGVWPVRGALRGPPPG